MSYINLKDTEDFSLFRNRIVFRMRTLGITSTKALAEKLYETNLFRRTDSTGNISSFKVSSIDKTIQKHLQFNIPNELPDSLNANHVQAYATTLDCSTDFILGNTNIISNDIYVQDLCNRTGLTESAISNLISMTDDQYAWKMLRIEATESRKILNSLLTSREFNFFLRSLNNISCEFHNKSHGAIDDLETQIGSERLQRACEWEYILDPLYSGPEPSELELKDVFLLREAMDKDYETKIKCEESIELEKYRLFKNFQYLIDKFYPYNC